ncbi:Ras-related GTP-binding protein D [Choanephora cucurbitarum]|uniref:GTP-binding protein n=1 Tax=Choanephora cucurbitarum TaxID=101091 RepID=A0A1C7NGU6_9FUNG|nr:Ras-related GTP-binding protein D [Choanephora cucurbitarum]
MNESYAYDPFKVEANGPTSTNQIMMGSPIDKPRILLMGLQRSGKSSIQRVVFGKMPPHDTLLLESTSKIQKEDVTRSFIDFQVWDFPGQVNYFDDTAYDAREIFDAVGSLVFVIDAQDDYANALYRLQYTILKVYQVNPGIAFEILIHKVDGLSDEYKEDVKEDIVKQMQDFLADIEQEETIQIVYHLTSIYDNSIYEAFSKIIQKLIRELPILEHLLDILRENSGVEKAYLFDTLTKIYIATDSTPVEMETYELCSDMVDVVLDIECIYGPQSGLESLNDNIRNEYNGDDAATVRDLEVGAREEETPTHLMNTNSVTDGSSIIKLNNGDVLYMREINSLLALICMIKSDNFKKYGLLNYNFQRFTEAVTDLFKFSQERGQRNEI